MQLCFPVVACVVVSIIVAVLIVVVLIVVVKFKRNRKMVSMVPGDELMLSDRDGQRSPSSEKDVNLSL